MPCKSSKMSCPTQRGRAILAGIMSPVLVFGLLFSASQPKPHSVEPEAMAAHSGRAFRAGRSSITALWLLFSF